MAGIILPYRSVFPSIAAGVYVAPTASVIGDVEIGGESSIWFSAAIRGDTNSIRIGARTNIQDGSVLHADPGDWPVRIGSDVTVGHGAVIHGGVLEDGCLVGMGATVLDGAVIESGAVLGAGSLVARDKRVKGGELWLGVPARRVRALDEEERRGITESARHYVERAAEYLAAERG